MKKRAKKKFIFWAPRISIILYMLFLSIFALDVFGEGYGFPEVIIALFMHLIPVFVLLIITIIAWKKPHIGGIIFIIIAIVFTILFNTYRDFIGFILISVPPLVIGLLFLGDKYLKKFKW